MRRLIWIGLWMGSLAATAQTDAVGSGRALSLNGFSNYVDFGNIYDNLTLPLTISAWVNLDPATTNASPIFTSQDNADIYNGIQLFIAPNAIIFEYGDGKGYNSPAFRKGKIALFNNPSLLGRWVHVCGVMNSAFDIHLYINGVEINGDFSGDSPYPMDSNFPLDVAKSGTYFSNGLHYWFHGGIDELRVWNRGLSATEVQATMCKKLSGNENGLIGYWTFDETSGSTVIDHSPNGFNGTLMFSPQRIYSGAPLGDASVFAYPPGSSLPALSMTSGQDVIKLSSLSGEVEGLQLYLVNDFPSQQGGLPSPIKPYFGAFAAGVNSVGAFDANITRKGTLGCSAYERKDNSVSTWSLINLPAHGVSERGEFILSDTAKLNVNLGPDLLLCNQSSYILNSGLDVSVHPLVWNTGATTSSITVSQSGLYWVRGQECFADTVGVFFLKSPEIPDLGKDTAMCVFSPRKLQATVDTVNYQFTWQDGTTTPTFQVKAFGTYWVAVKNFCGTRYDTIRIAQVPDLTINLGPDLLLCSQTTYVLNSGVNVAAHPIVWNTGETTTSITANHSGLYSVHSTVCPNQTDTLGVFFLKPPEIPVLGNDSVYCDFTPRVLRPTVDTVNYEFTWQDGSKKPTYAVTGTGTYWVSVKNYCGTRYDTVHYTAMPLFTVNLGPDQLLCNQTSGQINSGVNTAVHPVFWSTGESTSSITVTQPGLYSVKSKQCSALADTVAVFFLKSPEAPFLGNDTTSCSFTPRVLRPTADTVNYEFTWQNGSNEATFRAATFGTYWVSVKNYCGITSDTVHLRMIQNDFRFMPNVITANGDDINKEFIIPHDPVDHIFLIVVNRWGKEVYRSTDYQNDWDGGDAPAGTYYLKIQGYCAEYKTIVTIIR